MDGWRSLLHPSRMWQHGIPITQERPLISPLFLCLHSTFGFPVSCDHVSIGKLHSSVDIFCKHPLHSTNSTEMHIKIFEVSAEQNNTHMDILPTYSRTGENPYLLQISRLKKRLKKVQQPEIETNTCLSALLSCQELCHPCHRSAHILLWLQPPVCGQHWGMQGTIPVPHPSPSWSLVPSQHPPLLPGSSVPSLTALLGADTRSKEVKSQPDNGTRIQML